MAALPQCSTADWNMVQSESSASKADLCDALRYHERIEDLEWTKCAPGMVRPVVIQWSAPSTGKRKSNANGLAAKGFVLGDARTEFVPACVHTPAGSHSKSVFMDLVWPVRTADNDLLDEPDSSSVCSFDSAL